MMDVWMIGGWMDEWMYGRPDGLMCGWINVCADGRVDRWMDDLWIDDG
jgi:hypothetical protein